MATPKFELDHEAVQQILDLKGLVHALYELLAADDTNALHESGFELPAARVRTLYVLANLTVETFGLVKTTAMRDYLDRSNQTRTVKRVKVECGAARQLDALLAEG